MRSYLSTHNLIAVSANTGETAINTEQTLDTSMLCSVGDIINLDRRLESNEGEMTGLEEPDTLYDLGQTASYSLNFEKAQPQHIAFLAAYGLGAVSTGALGDGYKHTITPITGDKDASRSLPSFTAAQRYGKTVMKRRFASNFVDSLAVTFARDSWIKIVGNIKATGKVTTDITQEVVSALPTVTQLTLAANAVDGASGAGGAAERLQNVQQIRVELTSGVWTEVVYSAVSDATPAVITISAPGAGGEAVNYEITYKPKESGADWMTFPARVTETPMRVSQMSLNIGGKWSGSAFAGGRTVSAELKSLEWSLSNNLDVQFVPGATGTYAARAIRNGRTQKIKVDKDFKDYILHQHMADNDTFGLYIKLLGALYDDTYYYQVEFIFPKVGVLASPISNDNKRLSESGDLQVLEDATYGSVIVIAQNKVATYAA